MHETVQHQDAWQGDPSTAADETSEASKTSREPKSNTVTVGDYLNHLLETESHGVAALKIIMVDNWFESKFIVSARGEAGRSVRGKLFSDKFGH